MLDIQRELPRCPRVDRLYGYLVMQRIAAQEQRLKPWVGSSQLPQKGEHVRSNFFQLRAEQPRWDIRIGIKPCDSQVEQETIKQPVSSR